MTGSKNAGLAFGERKDFYKQFRISYPPTLYNIIGNASRYAHGHLAVDLGSGTGISSQPLLERFDKVIAVEPDPRMAEKIERRDRLEVAVAKAEDFQVADGSVDLVTCGTAFYWMDGPAVLARMARWIGTGGLVAIYRYALPRLPEKLSQMIDREFELHWNTHRHPRLLDEGYSWRCVQECGHFRHKKLQVVSNQAEMTYQTFVGFFGSTSYVGAYLRTLSAPGDYLASLEAEVRDIVGGGTFIADFPTELILAAHEEFPEET